MMLRKNPGLFLFLLFGLVSCKNKASRLVFYTDMGEMSVEIYRDLPGDAVACLQDFVAHAADSVQVSRLLHDGFIRFETKSALSIASLAPDKKRAAISGSLVWSGGNFYLLQGRKHSDATLDKWEQSARIDIPETFREQYKKSGGALQLEGRCTVFGKLVSGKEVLDRLAALPSDGAGKPLRPVVLKVEMK